MVVLNTVGRNDNFNPSSENYVDLYTYDIWAQGGYEYSERHVTALIGVINSQT